MPGLCLAGILAGAKAALTGAFSRVADAGGGRGGAPRGASVAALDHGRRPGGARRRPGMATRPDGEANRGTCVLWRDWVCSPGVDELTYRGRPITAADLHVIRELLAAQPTISRRALSFAVCAAWRWT